MARRLIGKNSTCAVALVGVFVLSGCDNRLLLSPEEKINLAFPVSDAVREAKTMIDAMPADVRREFADEYDRRMRLRVSNCAAGYSPSRFDSIDTVVRNLDKDACFHDADAATARWVGLRRAGLVLAKPPLRELGRAPASIVGDGTLQSVQFAARAGVALLQTTQSLEVVPLDVQAPIHREPRSFNALPSISPNGRLFTTGDNEHIRIADAETGNVLADLPTTLPQSFTWLDDGAALYVKAGDNGAVLVDFATATETPFPGIGTAKILGVVPSPKEDHRYFLSTSAGIAKVEIARDHDGLRVRQLADRRAPAGSIGVATPNADGTSVLRAGNELAIVASGTLEGETVSLRPFTAQSVVATPDPDRLVIVVSTPSTDPSTFVYSVAERSVTPVEGSPRYLFIPSLRKIGLVSENKVALLDSVPTSGTSRTVEQFRTDAAQLAEHRNVDLLEKQQATQDQIAAMRARARLPQLDRNRPDFSVQSLARVARVEAVGVYQPGPVRSTTEPNYVEVHFRRSAKSTILVLSSCEPVRWLVIGEAGARPDSVILAGSAQSMVDGATLSRILVGGSACAYEPSGPEYDALNRQVRDFLGKGIDLFHGRHDGGPFNVGG